MTMVNLSTKSGPYIGDGSNTTFSFGFHIEDADDLEVIHRDAAGTESILTRGTHYSLVAGSVDNVNGGSIIYPDPSGAAPVLPSTEKLVIRRNLSVLQDTNLRNQGAWNPEVVEGVFDEIYKLFLAFDEELARSIKYAVSSDPIDYDTLLTQIANAATYAANALAAQLAAEAARDAALAAGGSVTIGTTTTLTSADSPYTVTGSDVNSLLSCDTRDGAITINLPSIATVGEPYVLSIKKSTGDSNLVTVVPDGTDEIDEVAGNITLGTLNEARTFNADEDATPDNWITTLLGLQYGDAVIDSFIAGTDFTAGTSTSLTLSQSMSEEANVQVFFDGVHQQHSSFTVATTTITFDDPIPTGVYEVEIRLALELPIGTVPTGGVVTASLADGSVTLAKLAATAKSEHIAFACSDETTTLAVGTGVVTYRMPYAFTLTEVRASVTTAPTTSGTLTVDINKGGATILSTKITIDVTEKTSETAATPPVISDTALADDDEITVDIDAISGGATEAGLKVYLIGYRTS